VEKTPGDLPGPRGVAERPGEARLGIGRQLLGRLGNDADVRERQALDGELEEGDPELPGLDEREEQIRPGHRDGDTREPCSRSEVDHRPLHRSEVRDGSEAVEHVPFADVIPVGRRHHPARDRVCSEKTFEGLESSDLT
jgi:hypothetical protein